MEVIESALAKVEQIYLESAETSEERRLFSDFRTLWSDYRFSANAVLKQLEVGELSAAHHELVTTSLPLYDQAVANLDRLISMLKDMSRAAAAEAQEVYRRAILLTTAAIVLAALFTFAAILWTSRNISLPLLRISDAMRRLADGDETAVLVEQRKYNDEIAVLVDAVSGYRGALLRSRQLAAIADLERERLQVAITNMPIGLCMFDSAKRLIVCNDSYAEMYGLPPDLVKPGTLLDEMYSEQTGSGVFPSPHSAELKTEAVACNTKSERVLNIIELQDGRTISTILQPMAAGGWVSVHEDISERRRAEEQIRHMARHDSLTDLPNRVLFKQQMGEALKRVARRECVAVLCLDLDRFKSVNDTLGHSIGDLLLRQVGRRLCECVRKTDSVARFGGDEFAMIQAGVEQPQGATAMARRVIEAVSAPYEIENHQIIIGVSVGIAIAPNDGIDADALLKNADMALYRAKSDGRGTFRYFEPNMDAWIQERRLLELDLRKAVAQNEFQLFYQPIINVDRNEVTGFEALLRWQHPKRGIVSPAEFVPLAEEIGLIDPIGRWVLRQACHDAAAWPSHTRVAVNLSAAQFRNARLLLEAVMSALGSSELSASRLELEITETVLLVETEAALATLHKLRALGVRIAMDDFGTGYSSLSYLRSFPFDRIKIDRSFIEHVSEEASSVAIIRAVTSLGNSLGMAITAEGVETSEQLDRVCAEGCSEIQGFLFSPPRPVCDIPTMLGPFGIGREAVLHEPSSRQHELEIAAG
jgi:diguanylate cyclase (GGDEF)-like protein